MSVPARERLACKGSAVGGGHGLSIEGRGDGLEEAAEGGIDGGHHRGHRSGGKARGSLTVVGRFIRVSCPNRLTVDPRESCCPSESSV